MMSSASPEFQRVKSWLQRHRPRSSNINLGIRHWPWQPSDSTGLDRTSSATEIKTRFRNLIRLRHRSCSPLSTSTSRNIDPSTAETNTHQSREPPPPYSPATEVPPSSPPPNDALLSPSRIGDDTPPPGYRPPTGHHDRRPSAITPVSISEEQQRLEAVFTLHPWSPDWGPRPISLNEALKWAALLGNQRLVFTLLDAGAEIKPGDRDVIPEDSPVHSALYGPNPRIALDLLSHEFVSVQARQELVESRNALGLTPLHIAVEAGETEIARELIQFGSAVDTIDRFGRTSLHIAARYGRNETVDMLLDQGADAIINKQLWVRAADCAISQEALGQYNLISRVLQDALDRWGQKIQASATERGPPMGSSSRPPSIASQSSQIFGGSIESITRMSERRGARDRRSWTPSAENYHPNHNGLYSSPSRLPDADANCSPRRVQHRAVTMLSNSGTPRRHPGSLHRHSNSDAGPVRRSVYESRDLVPLRRNMMGGPGTPRRKAPQTQTLIFTPEYIRWKRNCETLQAESRAQREKNRRDGRLSGI